MIAKERQVIEGFRREMQLSDVSGRHFSLSLAELRRQLIAPTGLTFLALAIILLVLSDPPGYLALMPIWAAAAIWAVSLMCHIAGVFVFFGIAGMLQSRGRLGRIWVPLVSLVTSSATVSMTENLVLALIGPSYAITLFDKALFYFAIVQILEFAFIRFVLLHEDAGAPQAEADPAPVRDASPAPPAAFLDCGDRRLPLRRIQYLEAQEHYVEITLEAEKLLRRVRLGDLVSQVSETDGVQPHRSWWVSKQAVRRLEKRGARHVIVTRDGRDVPIARGRTADVIDWYDRNGPFGLEPAAAPKRSEGDGG